MIDRTHALPVVRQAELAGLSRASVYYLQREDFKVGRRHVATLMVRMGIEALYRKPNTSRKHPRNKVYGLRHANGFGCLLTRDSSPDLLPELPLHFAPMRWRAR